MEPEHKHDVAVVGAGVIGLAVAWRLRKAGADVLLVERDVPGAGASTAAAGMIAPVSEAQAGEPQLLDLCVRSAAMWPTFAAELEADAGLPVRLNERGTLMIARDRDGAEAVDREIGLRTRLGLDVERLLPSDARAREPALAPTIRLGASLSNDRAVDPQALIDALVAACRRTGVEIRLGCDVTDPEALDAARVVLACGPWSGAPVRPVKGQALALRDPVGAGLCEHVLRFEGGYLVPRGDGRYYLGATVEERGFDSASTALGVYELLRDCACVLPGVLELEIDRLITGFRPATPDNAPMIGALPGNDRIVLATGHYRHGILLGPITAELVAGELSGEYAGQWLDPARFAPVDTVGLSR